MQTFTVGRNFHPNPTTKGFRHAADFTINFAGAAYATIVLTALWNEKKTLVRGSNHTETIITDAATSISKAGVGWAVVADIAGDEPWVEFKNTVIRFRRRFTVELPIAPAISKIPTIGEMAKDLGATTITRIEAEGIFDVLSYAGKLKTTVY